MTRRERRILAELESSPVVWEIREFARDRGRYLGHASWVLQVLNTRADEATKNMKDWPKTPNQMGRLLNKLAPDLRLKGVNISYTRDWTLGRLWLIEYEKALSVKFEKCPVSPRCCPAQLHYTEPQMGYKG